MSRPAQPRGAGQDARGAVAPRRELDLEAWRRERDRAPRRPGVGAVSVDVATLWSGRVARHQAMGEVVQPTAAAPRARTTAVSALPPIERLRLLQVRPGAPRSRVTTRADMSPVRSDRAGEP